MCLLGGGVLSVLLLVRLLCLVLAQVCHDVEAAILGIYDLKGDVAELRAELEEVKSGKI